MDFQPLISNVIIQPTPFCNIDCDYCYLAGRSDRSVMSEATIEAVFERIFASRWCSDKIDIAWHAGEPLVLPPSYYETAFAIVERLRPAGVAIQHGFNSNGLLLTDAWCAFLKRTGAKIGLSIDGPRELHDAHRRTRSGKGTFDGAMRGADRLRRHGIDFYIIAVLTRDALSRPAELFEFFRSTGALTLGFNVEEVEGQNTKSSLEAAEAQQLYEGFLREFWNLLIAEPGRMVVREFEQSFTNILGNEEAKPPNGILRTYGYVNVDWRGGFSTWSPELLDQPDPRGGDFVLGNVHETSLDAALEAQKFKELKAEIDRGVEQCRSTCDYFTVCGGGHPANKLAEHGTFDCAETMFCRLTKKAVMNVALEILDGMAADAGR